MGCAGFNSDMVSGGEIGRFLDSRFRGNDGGYTGRGDSQVAIRIRFRAARLVGLWIPAFAGMTADMQAGDSQVAIRPCPRFREDDVVSGGKVGRFLDSRFRGNDGGICGSRRKAQSARNEILKIPQIL